jgi:hypothetical protein
MSKTVISVAIKQRSFKLSTNPLPSFSDELHELVTIFPKGGVEEVLTPKFNPGFTEATYNGQVYANFNVKNLAENKEYDAVLVDNNRTYNVKIVFEKKNIPDNFKKRLYIKMV